MSTYDAVFLSTKKLFEIKESPRPILLALSEEKVITCVLGEFSMATHLFRVVKAIELLPSAPAYAGLNKLI